MITLTIMMILTLRNLNFRAEVNTARREPQTASGAAAAGRGPPSDGNESIMVTVRRWESSGYT